MANFRLPSCKPNLRPPTPPTKTPKQKNSNHFSHSFQPQTPQKRHIKNLQHKIPPNTRKKHNKTLNKTLRHIKPQNNSTHTENEKNPNKTIQNPTKQNNNNTTLRKKTTKNR